MFCATVLTLLKKSEIGQVLVAHACNPSYSGSRDQEDRDSKQAWANSSRDPILKKAITQRAGVVAQGVGPEVKCKKIRN
jgi:hypothetical protein